MEPRSNHMNYYIFADSDVEGTQFDHSRNENPCPQLKVEDVFGSFIHYDFLTVKSSTFTLASNDDFGFRMYSFLVFA